MKANWPQLNYALYQLHSYSHIKHKISIMDARNAQTRRH